MASSRPNVIVAYDGSESARRALAHAADVVGLGGNVIVVNVIRTQSVSSRIETVSERARDAQDRLLSEAESMLASRGVNAKLVGAAGDPAREILAAAEAAAAALIVIGRRKRRALHLGRPLSDALVSRATTDVLVVH